MRSRSSLSAAAVLLALATGVFAQSTQPTTLRVGEPAPPVKISKKVGDPAPPLTVSKWVKGEPVTKFEPGKIYVLDFWATWCVPCRAAMPHLTELAKKYPEIVFIGQNVSEDDPDGVGPFIKEMGDKIGFRVALDDTSANPMGAMAAGWMAAAGVQTIPTTFVVDQTGKLAWFGHPMELDAVLEQMKAGTFDAKAAAAKQEKITQLGAKIQAAVRAKDVDGVLAATKELAAVMPEEAEGLAVFEYNILAKNGRPDAARVRADGVARTSKNVQALNSLAWAMATAPAPQPADLTIARVAIDRALEISGMKDADILDTSARIYALEKDWPKAVAVSEQAIRIAEPNAKANLQRSLDAYQKQQLPAAE